jgi:hypothetical protein
MLTNRWVNLTFKRNTSKYRGHAGKERTVLTFAGRILVLRRGLRCQFQSTACLKCQKPAVVSYGARYELFAISFACCFSSCSRQCGCRGYA